MVIGFKITYTILLLYTSFLLKKTYNYIKSTKFYTLNIERLKHGIIQIEDLHELTPNEFEHWCADFLGKEGFNNLYITPKGSDDGKDIICNKANDIYYVECTKFVLSQSEKHQIDIEIVKKLIGSMASEKITNGIIITSGIFTKDAINYIETLPKPYNILMYNGEDLVEDYNELNKLLVFE